MRKVFAVIFALIAILASILIVLDSLSHELPPPRVLACFVALPLLSAATSMYLFRSAASWLARRRCGACGSVGDLAPASLMYRRPSVAALLFGGIFITLLIQHLPSQSFRCGKCSSELTFRPAGSILTVLWCLLIIALIIVGVIDDTEP